MKHRLIVLGLALILLLCACSPASSQEAEPSCFFYYPTVSGSDDTLLPLAVALDPAQLSVEEFLTHYLGAQVPAEAMPVLPTSWKLLSVSTVGSVVYLEFGGGKTTQIQRSVSLSCLTQTLLQHPHVNSISAITPESESPLLLTANDILFVDTGMEPQQEQVTLYFPDAKCRYLISETRTVDASQASGKPAFILQELLAKESPSCIPAGTELLSVSVENGVCTVDLSSEFEQNMENSFAAERMAVYSIVNSLTELPEISTVDLWVAGAPLDSLCRMDLSQGISRDESLLSVPMGDSLQDVSIYPACGAENLLVEIPLMLELREDLELTEQVIHALISFEGRNGLINCVPEGTKLLSVRMENNVCVLDFTGEFLAGCANAAEEALAVRSVITTVCSLEGIHAVEILVEGIEPNFRDDGLSNLRRPQKDWISD